MQLKVVAHAVIRRDTGALRLRTHCLRVRLLKARTRRAASPHLFQMYWSLLHRIAMAIRPKQAREVVPTVAYESTHGEEEAAHA